MKQVFQIEKSNIISGGGGGVISKLSKRWGVKFVQGTQEEPSVLTLLALVVAFSL